MDAETLDVEAVVDLLKISKHRIYQLTRRNLLPCHRPTGRKIIFFKKEIEDFIKNGTKNRTNNPGVC
jgi:excisionase family DNA binding protein